MVIFATRCAVALIGSGAAVAADAGEGDRPCGDEAAVVEGDAVAAVGCACAGEGDRPCACVQSGVVDHDGAGAGVVGVAVEGDRTVAGGDVSVNGNAVVGLGSEADARGGEGQGGVEGDRMGGFEADRAGGGIDHGSIQAGDGGNVGKQEGWIRGVAPRGDDFDIDGIEAEEARCTVGGEGVHRAVKAEIVRPGDFDVAAVAAGGTALGGNVSGEMGRVICPDCHCAAVAAPLAVGLEAAGGVDMGALGGEAVAGTVEIAPDPNRAGLRPGYVQLSTEQSNAIAPHIHRTPRSRDRPPNDRITTPQRQPIPRAR